MIVTSKQVYQSISALALSLTLFTCSSNLDRLLTQEKLNANEYQELLKAAEDGNTKAQLAIAHYYENGINTNTDTVTAVTWYHKAAEAGNTEAQYSLGLRYYSGTSYRARSYRGCEVVPQSC